jgi:hypothetical protein
MGGGVVEIEAGEAGGEAGIEAGGEAGIEAGGEAGIEAGGAEGGASKKATPGETFAAAAPAYLEHGSIAYGADWGFRAGPRGVPDVVASCSFYDRGVRAWSRA